MNISRVLELMLAYSNAHAVKNVRMVERYLAELRTHLQPFNALESRNHEPIGYAAGSFGDDVGYDVAVTDDDGRMCLRLYESTERDCAVSLTYEQAAQVRRDLLRVMLRMNELPKEAK